MNPIFIILGMAAEQLEKLRLDPKVFELPETIEETNLPLLNDYALVNMLKSYERYEKNPTYKKTFGTAFRVGIFLYRTVPGFRRRMNWVFTTLSVYFLNYRYYAEKSMMPCRWDMTDEQITKDIEEKGY